MQEVSKDIDGYINEQFYLTACIDIINRSIQDMGQDAQTITTNKLSWHLVQCYNALFKPNTPQTNKKNIIEYNEENLLRLVDIYLNICKVYDTLPSVDGFETLTGVYFETVDRVVTSALPKIRKARKAYVQNRLNNSTIGVLALANNDIDTGLLYTRQNIVDHATVRKALSFSDLQQIATKQDDEDAN